MSDFKGFHVGEYIAEELDARCWDRNVLASRMGGDISLNRLSIDFLIDAPRLQMWLGRETADGLSRAFGSSSDVWLGLDKSWHEANGVHWEGGERPCQDS